MPTTAARRAWIPWACQWFLDQDTSDADLMVVGEGASVADLVPTHERIRYVHLEGDDLPLGHKYNECAKRAEGPLVALWADDDWQAPWKLRYLRDALAQKPGALIVGARAMLFHRLGTGRTWLYDKPGDPSAAYFLGGSVLFHKDYWLEHRKFAEGARRAADASFTNSLSREQYAELAVVVPKRIAMRMYVATIHPRNTGRPDADPSGPGWSRVDEGGVRDLMGAAYELWQPGGRICERIGVCG
jgi:hypothetical protein